MKTDKIINGHLAAILTIIIWGTTFISTKILLGTFTAVYIYLVPVITVLASMIILNERITTVSFIGIILILAELIFLVRNIKRRNYNEYKGNEMCNGD